MISRARGSALLGVEAWSVDVEVDIAPGSLPALHIVGLPEATVRESRVRVRSALANCGYSLPSARVTINLAPADLRKEGTGFDLAIAIAAISASLAWPPGRLDPFVLVAEVGLDGTLRPVPGALAHAMGARRAGAACVVVAAENADEAALIPGIEVHGARDLPAVVELVRAEARPRAHAPVPVLPPPSRSVPDLQDVRGQPLARRCLELAAAGGHHLLLVGPPGCGKTMLAQRLAGILPEMSVDERIETTAVWSVAGALATRNRSLVLDRPFRAPHHTVSDIGLVGGGSTPGPGELSLAHNGVLFLDELPEFRRGVLEAMRQPLEDGAIVIARAAGRIRLPCRTTLVAAMNPCPCGWAGSAHRTCRCPPSVVERYQARISGPLLDRIDLIVRMDHAAGARRTAGEGSETVRERVMAARERQTHRWRGVATNGTAAGASAPEMAISSSVLAAAVDLAAQAELTSRGLARALRVARTAADLDGSERVLTRHVAEAVALRVPLGALAADRFRAGRVGPVPDERGDRAHGNE